MYVRYANRNGLKTEALYQERGKAGFKVIGQKASAIFKHESGKHVVQRCPPTENRGRRHTSTVCVAILPLVEESRFTLDESDLEVYTKRGSGPGGQHRNKTESCVTMKHKPTGLSVTIDSRDQHANKRMARQILESRVYEHLESTRLAAISKHKSQQVDGGGRSNKVRTYNFIDNRVTDHLLGTKTNQVDKIMKGHLEHILNG